MVDLIDIEKLLAAKKLANVRKQLSKVLNSIGVEMEQERSALNDTQSPSDFAEVIHSVAKRLTKASRLWNELSNVTRENTAYTLPREKAVLNDSEACAIGIDVGGERKGFHAVLLIGKNVEEVYRSSVPKEIVAWCLKHAPLAIGIDAPCHWSSDGHARTAECEMASESISCYSTPTHKTARRHHTNYYGWMMNGMRLYRTLKKTFPLFSGEFTSKLCFETYPHAIARALSGADAEAGGKAKFRRQVLSDIGTTSMNKLLNIDFVDAALCAVTASSLLQGRVRLFGQYVDGIIVVPASES